MLLDALILAGGLTLAANEPPTVTVPPKKCAPRSEVAKTLSDKFGEVPAFSGVTEDLKHLVEIFANGESRTWTAFVVSREGIACMISSGQGWVMDMPEPGEPA